MKHAGLLAQTLRLLLILVRLMPLSAARQLGLQLGYLFAHLPLRDVKRAHAHLRRAFPDTDQRFIDKTTIKCFGHFGCSLMTLLRLVSVPRERFIKMVKIEGLENLEAHTAAERRGEGSILLGGHFGNWELQMRFMGLFGRMLAIGRRIDNPALDAFVIKYLRTRDANIKTIYQDQGLLVAARGLRKGGNVCMVPDQDLPKIPGIFSTWFGIPAWTPSAPAKLARSHKAAIQPVYFYERAGRFVLHWGPRKYFKQSDDEDADVQYMTDWIMAYQEQLVRRFPEQWVWWHRRWRTQPDEIASRPT